jgi:NAD(P)-dependent dehydrogenase (short-subunit alcohol dehydrogenase family)
MNNTTSISSFAAAVLSDTDRIDALVNNAGVIDTAISNGSTRSTTSVAYTTHYLGIRPFILILLYYKYTLKTFLVHYLLPHVKRCPHSAQSTFHAIQMYAQITPTCRLQLLCQRLSAHTSSTLLTTRLLGVYISMMPYNAHFVTYAAEMQGTSG